MSTLPETTAPAGIDPRGPRAGASVTSALLIAVLLLADQPAGMVLLALVAASFANGVVVGPARSVLGVAYRRVLAPRLAPVTEREDPRPPRFAQGVGLTLTTIGLVLALLGVPGALAVAASLALVAAFLNAAFGLCLGCEIYLLLLRRRRRSPSVKASARSAGLSR